MSKQINNGGPAFPHSSQPLDAQGNPICENHSEWGMSLRDWFAGQALNGWLASFESEDGSPKAKGVAELCFSIADAMIAESQKQEPHDA